MNEKLKIAVVVSHPIQHFCPQYVSFSENKELELKVFFGSTLGYQSYIDVNFQKEISWGNLQLDKFEHIFLNDGRLIQTDKNLDAPELEKELAIFEPAMVITYGYFQKLQRRAHRWSIENKIPIAYISDSELRHKQSWVKTILKQFFLRRYFSKIDYFLTVGNANEAYYRKYGVGNEKFVRMNFPIDLVAYEKLFLKKAFLREEIRTKYQISQADIVISVVGKLVDWKNQDHIIDALKILEAEGLFIHLFILGSGKMKDEWEMKARDLRNSKVFFTGFVDIEDLPAYYAATDIYVHPASLEPHSIGISEAIFMGCPVILSDRCGSYGESDDVQQGRNGLVYEFGNIPKLADKIKMLAMDKKMRREFSIHSHEIAVSFQQNSHFTMIQNLMKRYKRKHEKK